MQLKHPVPRVGEVPIPHQDRPLRRALEIDLERHPSNPIYVEVLQDWSGGNRRFREPAEQNDVLDGSDPMPRHCDMDSTLNQLFITVHDEEMTGRPMVDFDDGIVD